MIIEESRILQVSIFHTLEKNLSTVNFNLLLADVMTIADECDSQLKQTINSFMDRAAQVQRRLFEVPPALSANRAARR
jgi:hypothetical protein